MSEQENKEIRDMEVTDEEGEDVKGGDKGPLSPVSPSPGVGGKYKVEPLPPAVPPK